MSGGLPDAQIAVWPHDHYAHPDKEISLTLIQVKLIRGVFTEPQKQEIVARLTDAMVEIEGENMRRATWCVLEEVASGDWGVGGQTLTADDVRALARG